jgi:hypothetical protein
LAPSITVDDEVLPNIGQRQSRHSGKLLIESMESQLALRHPLKFRLIF